jgi:hypothetical protein
MINAKKAKELRRVVKDLSQYPDRMYTRVRNQHTDVIVPVRSDGEGNFEFAHALLVAGTISLVTGCKRKLYKALKG